MNLITGRNTPEFAKDTVYRFTKMIQINWIRFTTLLLSQIIKDAIIPLDSKDRVNVLLIDDSMFERKRSKKVELLEKHMITQITDTVSGFVCSNLDGQMGAHSFLSTAFSSLLKTGRTGSMKPRMLINEPLDINGGCFPCKKEHRQCLHF